MGDGGDAGAVGADAGVEAGAEVGAEASVGESAAIGAQEGTQEKPGDAVAPNMSTVYNGSLPCAGCGYLMNPVMAIFGYSNLCPECMSRSARKKIKDRMA